MTTAVRVNNIYRVIGAPGSGKTEYLRRQVQAWHERDGIEPDRMVLCSFTRTAASVLRGRVPVPEHNATTLHSLAWRAIGNPEIAEVGELARQWNDQQIPESWKLRNVKSDLEEGIVDEHDQGTMLADYNLYRSSGGIDYALHEKTKDFAEAWGDFKSQNNDAVDFQDMIDLALLNAPVCPGDPVCFVVDEAQDLQPMQWLLAKQWGNAAKKFMVAGDAAQVLYGWIGARPDELLESLPPEQHRMLGQSYRLPRRIQSEAELWLSKHSGRMMDGRFYRPQEREGVIAYREDNWRTPYGVLEDVERVTAAGRTVMVLASCSYLLGPTISMLRAAGIPFHNPHRRSNGAWNPLQRQEGKTSTQQRVRLFMAPEWTGARAANWLEMLPAAWFTGTKKTALERLAGLGPVSDSYILDLLREEARGPVAQRDVSWLARSCGSKYERPLELIAAIVSRYGGIPEEEPRVVVGTIHSVKGAEADTVLLFPDLPKSAADSAAATVAGRDAVIRQAYVGMTRAKEELIWYAPQRDVQSFWGV